MATKKKASKNTDPITYTVKVWADGTKEWYINGVRHRADGPAYEGVNGSKHWYLDDKLHRVNGPAIEWADGSKEWFLDGKRHRVDGPAIEGADGTKQWWLDDKWITEDEHRRRSTKKPDCDGKVVDMDGVKYRLVRV